MNSDSPDFIADTMLGRLARWLRALGYDTVYDTALDDDALAQRAQSERRILLTRDVELTRRRGLRAILVRDDRVGHQLRQVVRELGLSTRGAFSRCLACNTLLQDITPQQAEPEVPPYAFKTQTRFRRCPHCGRIYWRGTHWTHMHELLKDLEHSDRAGSERGGTP